MNIKIPDHHKASEIFASVKKAESGAVFYCTDERQFSLAKIALVKSQRTDLSIQLKDAQSRLLKQVVPRRKNAKEEQQADEMNSNQVSAIRALEDAFRQCQAMKLTVIGFSDGLVAVPNSLGGGMDALSSTAAIDVDTSDVYRGYEADEE
ncbi:MAG: hypothetical protein OQJ91_16695 [Motiliproteus sp.]|nr:hypothetical protein [Motiliproteus sp.]